MIDNFAILFFGSCIVFLAVRAIRLDQTFPWFDDIEETDASKLPKQKISDRTK